MGERGVGGGRRRTGAGAEVRVYGLGGCGDFGVRGAPGAGFAGASVNAGLLLVRPSGQADGSDHQ